MRGLAGLAGLATAGQGVFGHPNLSFGRPGSYILALWGTILVPRGNVFVIQGIPGPLHRTPWGPLLDFLWIWDGFGVPIGTLFGIIVETFPWFGATE